MRIGEAIREYRNERGISQREVADALFVDRSLIAKVENGLPIAEHHEPKIARLSWKLALAIIDERSGGYISNLLEEMPNLDLHPAALKDLLMKELEEAEQALGGLLLARHIDPQKRKDAAEKTWAEIRDVIQKALVMQGVLEEEFNLDRDRLIKKHDMEVKEGKR